MTKLQLLAALAGLASIAGATHAGPPVRTSVAIGFNVGPAVPYYRPYYAPFYGPYYRPYPYYYAPPAVIVEPAPVIYRQAPVIVQQPVETAQPAPIATPAQPASYQSARPGGNADAFLANLRSTDEAVRRDSVMELGRMKAIQAVQPLTATLAGDQSPVVREAAARALGLIASPNALVALQHAAQADSDRDVRHSAQFAVEIIKSNSR
jgi:hypothetical protein